MASQAEQLPKNIETLISTVTEIKSKTFLVPQLPKIEIDKFLLTKRQIAKKMILISAGAIGAAGNVVEGVTAGANTIITSTAALDGSSTTINPVTEATNSFEYNFALNAANMIGQKVTPEAAHFIVYGKFLRDSDGNLIDNEVLYPECVLQELAMPDTHPTMANIQVMITQAQRVLRMLPIKQQEMLDDIAQAMIAIPASITSIASAAAIMPPGAGIPVAFSAFQGLMANIMNIVSKIAGVTVDIEYLNYIPLLVDSSKLDAILGIINGVLIAINTVLMTIDGLTSIIPSVPTPPGVGNEPGEPIEVEGSIIPDTINKYDVREVVLKANATKGSWEYEYRWYGPNGFSSTEKEIKILVGPFDSSQTFRLQAIDKKDTSNASSIDVVLTVAQ